MIIWLSSFPRSGNTLLRTLLKQTMGYQSYSDESNDSDPISGKGRLASDVGGLSVPDDDWDRFYREATASSETFLVKTHRLPRDSQPAIYVVRDGRKALLSYSYFHRDFNGNGARSLLELVLNGDFYGGWSAHFDAWSRRKGPTLHLKYEEIVNPTEATLDALAEFVGHRGPRQPWQNPFAELQEKAPLFFRQGQTQWDGDPRWSPSLNSVFFLLHGDAMLKCGYSSSDEVAYIKEMMPAALRELAEFSAQAVAQRTDFAKICDERQHVIEELDRACRERLEVIESLALQCQERQKAIEALSKACNERLSIINKLSIELQNLKKSSA
ncbi:sulfotransferase domain-containing protein [Arenibaculum pallidiluteum]|uniref:sulfotransferase domain-containing protein n=1 Tax=Arenibaculum pallidiluteum TaxID=2812559 RepID=UPI001A97C595|nr:sulfotransferase domain-containing protein [Arenibaculum pallidiluteum]